LQLPVLHTVLDWEKVTSSSGSAVVLTVKNGGRPEVLELGVQKRVDGRQSLLGGEVLPCVGSTQVKPHAVAVPRLKTFVVHPELDARDQPLRKL